jgi:hypothetical protein
MPFDSATRSELQKMVGRARDLLVEEFTAQCQGVYGIQPDGTLQRLESLTHLSDEERTRAHLLRDRVLHLASGLAGPKRQAEAVVRMVREQAFTVLNRLCALRMCEERGLVQEVVRAGYQSKGFRLYDQAAVRLGGDTYSRYRLFLELLFDELAVDLGVLFDRYSSYGLLFPRENGLQAVLAEINAPSLARIWAEDEAIGWVYQYFNSEEERRAMRKASSAPRNSRELAVRNQFFTPRYVVEFLTDNTLGRTWYEMRKGETALKESCRYLVRRPKEEFRRRDAEEEISPQRRGERRGDAEFVEGVVSAPSASARCDPILVPERPKKDPRDLKILDPACGSGHFLLYAFDLLETIYREAWEDSESPSSENTGTRLAEDYPSRETLDAAIPELILRWNLYGIDIDPRAAQIAALSLWLRAQRAWQGQGVKPAERPSVRKSNIVCAEPMPGEKDFLGDFAEHLRPRVLGQLVEVIFERMQLAGEAGSLLRVEDEIQGAIEEARRQWLAGPKPEQAELFPETLAPRQGELRFDFTGVGGAAFWNQAEDRILESLRAYAEAVEDSEGIGRRLFAEDAVRGFAFMDLCRQSYDVVLMNPPFGAASERSKTYVGKAYPRSKNDLLAAFVERGVRWLRPRAMLGAITSRTAFFLTSFQKWREGVVLGEARPTVVADLGYGVMDAAMVEAAAYVLERQ